MQLRYREFMQCFVLWEAQRWFINLQFRLEFHVKQTPRKFQVYVTSRCIVGVFKAMLRKVYIFKPRYVYSVYIPIYSKKAIASFPRSHALFHLDTEKRRARKWSHLFLIVILYVYVYYICDYIFWSSQLIFW